MRIVVNCTDYNDVTNPNCRYKNWSTEYDSDYIPRIGECIDFQDAMYYRKVSDVFYHISNGVIDYVEVNTEERDCTPWI